MIPKSTGWQKLRTACLETIPHGASVYHTRAMPLHEWRTKGSFRVTSCTKSGITIQTSAVEAGTVLLSDAEHLLDHAAEQHASLKPVLSGAHWHSPAWSVVTAYYWGFFSAMAITRLSGIGPWFLSRAALADLKKLAGAAEQPPAGALRFATGVYVDATDREITLRPSRNQLHDALWNRTSQLLSDVFSSANEAAGPMEYRLFRCLNEANSRLGSYWPTETRNLVNYLPGRAYREVIQRNDIDIASYMRRESPFDFEQLVSLFEDQTLKLRTHKAPAEQIPTRCTMLVLFSTMLWMIAGELLSEIIERNSSDRRWLNLRKEFLLRTCAAAPGGSIWPLAG